MSKFDYQRSYSLLGQLSNAGLLKEMAGIYIVSYISQIRQGSELDYSTVLVQDLSRLPPDYIDSWVELTKTQFGKPQYWDKETLDYQLLRIRTILAQAAPLVTLTESALASDVVKKIWPSQR